MNLKTLLSASFALAIGAVVLAPAAQAQQGPLVTA